MYVNKKRVLPEPSCHTISNLNFIANETINAERPSIDGKKVGKCENGKLENTLMGGRRNGSGKSQGKKAQHPETKCSPIDHQSYKYQLDNMAKSQTGGGD